jgi:hypothetical protein
MKFSVETQEAWIEQYQDRMTADRALTVLADMLVNDWCSQYGDPPTNQFEQLAMRCQCGTAAEELLAKLLAMPDGDKRALANRLWPHPRMAETRL